MHYALSFGSYRRKLRHPLKMSRGTIAEREGVLLRLESEGGKVTFGEAVILPYFQTETINESKNCLKNLGEIVSKKSLELVSKNCLATYFALESALLEQEGVLFDGLDRELNVSYLVRSTKGDSVKDLISSSKLGYKTFKWKIGISSFQEEREVFSELLKHLPENGKLRLDANGGLSLQQAREWLKISEGMPVEFIEQPLAEDKIDELFKLAEESETLIALDEAVSSVESLYYFKNLGWKEIYVVKPSRLGSLSEFLRWRNSDSSQIVYSSALETSIGTELGLKLASSDRFNNYAVGYGVSQWFENDGFYIHEEAPVIRVGENMSEDFHKIFKLLHALS